MIEDPDRCYQAAQSKDARFDGQFFCAVTSTGIYCRPSCPARTPKRENMRFYATAAAAQQAGFRACLRCRPDATPGSPEWNVRADVVARAMRLIRDGVVDREGVEGLAGRLGYSTRQLNRLITAEVGTGPLALARAQRSQTARVLLETTDLPVAHVAFAAGFASVRQCNDTVRQTFADTPSGLRARAARTVLGRRYKREPAAQAIRLRLPCRQPFNPASVLDFLGLRALPGVEALDGVSYTRSLRLPHGHGIVTLRAPEAEDGAEWQLTARPTWKASSSFRTCATCRLRWRAAASCSTSMPTLSPSGRPSGATRSSARWCDAIRDDACPAPPTASSSPYGPSSANRSRSPARARWPAGWCWPPVNSCPHQLGAVTHLFPTPAALVELAEDDPGAFSMPAGRRRAVVALAQAVDAGDVVIDPGADPAELRRSLVALPGIGPWTAEYVAMRALRDPDAFMPTDLGIRRGAVALGLPDDPTHLRAMTEHWRPWRSYAMAHLWACRPPPHRNSPPDGRKDVPHDHHHTSQPPCPVDTPIGQIVLESDGDVLIGLRLPNAVGLGRRDEESPVLKEAATQLEEYFAGERTEFDLRMELDGTPFQREVWSELSRIPYGETISYGELARRVGRPKGPRAVGQANGRNPIAIIVPCHRVLASNGIGGYGGGLTVKRALLALEGVSA